MMRTTLSLDPVILTAAKEVAAETNRSLGAVISDWARRGLQSRAQASAGAGKTKAARAIFPTFEVPADSPPITSQRVRDLLNSEGL
jgi:hypothetical protein